jgi:hypothetical protein
MKSRRGAGLALRNSGNAQKLAERVTECAVVSFM